MFYNALIFFFGGGGGRWGGIRVCFLSLYVVLCLSMPIFKLFRQHSPLKSNFDFDRYNQFE